MEDLISELQQLSPEGPFDPVVWGFVMGVTSALYAYRAVRTRSWSLRPPRRSDSEPPTLRDFRPPPGVCTAIIWVRYADNRRGTINASANPGPGETCRLTFGPYSRRLQIDRVQVVNPYDFFVESFVIGGKLFITAPVPAMVLEHSEVSYPLLEPGESIELVLRRQR